MNDESFDQLQLRADDLASESGVVAGDLKIEGDAFRLAPAHSQARFDSGDANSVALNHVAPREQVSEEPREFVHDPGRAISDVDLLSAFIAQPTKVSEGEAEELSVSENVDSVSSSTDLQAVLETPVVRDVARQAATKVENAHLLARAFVPAVAGERVGWGSSPPLLRFGQDGGDEPHPTRESETSVDVSRAFAPTSVKPLTSARRLVREVDEPDTIAASAGSWWTIPLIAAGVGLVAMCLLIPATDETRQLAYEKLKLQADLTQLEKQEQIGDAFLQRIAVDPGLSERLAQRQMQMVRVGTKVLDVRNVAGTPVQSPFGLVTVPPPAAVPAYRPIGGKIAGWIRDGRTQLYVLGAALFCIAAGLVVGSSPRAESEPAASL